MCGTMEVTLAVYICVAVLVPTSYGSSSEARSATSLLNHKEVIYSVFDKPQIYGEIFLHGFIFNLTCDEGFSLDGSDVTPVYTLYVNGTWTPRIPECKRWCKPLQSLNVDLQCQYKGKEIDCSKSVPVGTEATGQCKMGYLPTKRAVNASIVCGENGQWSENLIECEAPDCGRKDSTELLSSWLVVIHRDDSLRCLGTLISPHIVLTSARCMYSEDEDFRLWQTFHVTVGVDVPSVREVSIHPQYFGDDTSYALNLALLDLETSVPNMPACIDWGRKIDVTPEQRGVVAARDSPYYGNITSYIEYEYVDYKTCVTDMPFSDRRYLTESKLCLKRLNGTEDVSTSVRGSAFMYEHNGIQYVKGVMSNWWERGFPGSIYAATNVTDPAVLQWIFQTKQSFDAFHAD